MMVEMIHAQLDGIGEIPSEIYAAADAETVDAFFAQYPEMMEASEDEFTPDLEWIDSILASLFIS